MSEKRAKPKPIPIEFFLHTHKVVCQFPSGACIEIRERPEWPGRIELSSSEGALLIEPHVSNVIRVRPTIEF